MKKTYQTPVITAIDIAVESQILALEAPPLNSAMARYLIRVRQMLEEWDTS